MNELNNFNKYSEYYDALYCDKNYLAEAGYIRDKLVQLGLPTGKLLEFGSGTGKHACILAGMGYKIKGIEKSPEMVSRVKAAENFTCIVGDIRKERLGITFDAVLSLFHVLSYQVCNDDVTAVFNRASDHLESGGFFIFDIWYSPAVYAQKPEIRIKRATSGDVKIIRISEPEILSHLNMVNVHFTILAADVEGRHLSTYEEVHPMRHFSLPELDLFAGRAGFTRVFAEEFLTGEQAGENSWGVCLCYRKG